MENEPARSPVHPPIPLFINPRSGLAHHQHDELLERLLAAATRWLGGAPHVCQPDDDLVALVREAAAGHPPAVAVAGGDGTISAAASVLAGGPVPLGIIPFGTLNHFARDASLPNDCEEACRVIAAGQTRAVDVAQVNGRVFVNNSSLGLYAELVVERERREQQLGKWRALARAMIPVLQRAQPQRVRLRWAARDVRADSYLLFIGNNPYPLITFRPGQRETLDSGLLQVHLLDEPGHRRAWRWLRAALPGSVSANLPLRSARVTRLTVDLPEPCVRVACDGEVLEMATPLVYESRPRALMLCAPRPS